MDIDHAAKSYTKVAFEGSLENLSKTVDVNEATSGQMAEKAATVTQTNMDSVYAEPEKTFFTRKHVTEKVGDLQCMGYCIKGIQVSLNYTYLLADILTPIIFSHRS